MTSEILDEVYTVVKNRRDNPSSESYTSGLLAGGKVKEKVREEFEELLAANNRDEIIHETADAMFHILVLLAANSVELDEVMKELEERRR